MAKKTLKSAPKPRSEPAVLRSEARQRRASDNPLLAKTFVAGVVAVFISMPVLTPLLITLPFIPRLFGAGERPVGIDTLWRWALTVFGAVACCYAFDANRVAGSAMFGSANLENLSAWIAGSGGHAPAGFAYLLLSMLVFAVATVATLGVGGLVVLSALVSSAAVTAAYLYAAGHNIVQITLIAVSPWQLALFAAMLFLQVPLSAFSRQILVNRKPGAFQWQPFNRQLVVGGLLFATSLILRVAAAGGYATLVRRWTVM